MYNDYITPNKKLLKYSPSPVARFCFVQSEGMTQVSPIRNQKSPINASITPSEKFKNTLSMDKISFKHNEHSK